MRVVLNRCPLPRALRSQVLISVIQQVDDKVREEAVVKELRKERKTTAGKGKQPAASKAKGGKGSKAAGKGGKSAKAKPKPKAAKGKSAKKGVVSDGECAWLWLWLNG